MGNIGITDNNPYSNYHPIKHENNVILHPQLRAVFRNFNKCLISKIIRYA